MTYVLSYIFTYFNQKSIQQQIKLTFIYIYSTVLFLSFINGFLPTRVCKADYIISMALLDITHYIVYIKVRITYCLEPNVLSGGYLIR